MSGFIFGLTTYLKTPVHIISHSSKEQFVDFLIGNDFLNFSSTTKEKYAVSIKTNIVQFLSVTKTM